MPICIIDSNAEKYSRNLPGLLIELLSRSFNMPETTVMVEINAKKSLLLRGSAPCIYVQCRSVQNVSAEEKAKTAVLLNELLAEEMSVHRSRIFIEFVKVDYENFAVEGKLLDQEKH